MTEVFVIDDDKVAQAGGKGTDYAAWLKSDKGTHICIYIGQCGDAPDGDPRARRIVEAMVAGLNENAKVPAK